MTYEIQLEIFINPLGQKNPANVAKLYLSPSFEYAVNIDKYPEPFEDLKVQFANMNLQAKFTCHETSPLSRACSVTYDIPIEIYVYSLRLKIKKIVYLKT